jgi:hypothetical protein
MNNVRKNNNYVNISSSQTFTAFKYSKRTDSFMSMCTEPHGLVSNNLVINYIYKLIEMNEKIRFCNIITLPFFKHLTSAPFR